MNFGKKKIERKVIKMLNGELQINDYASIEELNREYVVKYLNLFGNPEIFDFFKKKGIIKEEANLIYLTLLGTIFFGKNPQDYYPHLFIEISTYKEMYLNNLSEIIKPSDNVKIAGTILEMQEQALNYITDYCKTKIKNNYPHRVLFELINNCLLHRSYNKRFIDTSIKIAIYPNCIIFTSPGGLIEQERKDLLKNPKLYKLYQEYNIINEDSEIGWEVIKKELAKFNYPEPEVIITNNSYKVILWHNNHQLKIPEEQSVHLNNFDLSYKKLSNAF